MVSESDVYEMIDYLWCPIKIYTYLYFKLKMVNKFGTYVKTVSQEDADFYAESKMQF